MKNSVPFSAAALVCLLGCSTPVPAPLSEAAVGAIQPVPMPSVQPRLGATRMPTIYYVDPQVIAPEAKSLPPPQFCYVGTSCLELDSQPFRPCRLGEDCPKDAELLKAEQPEPRGK